MNSSNIYKARLTILLFLIFIIPVLLFIFSSDHQHDQIKIPQNLGKNLEEKISYEINRNTLLASNTVFQNVQHQSLSQDPLIIQTLNKVISVLPETSLMLFVNMDGIVQAANTRNYEGIPLASASLIGKSFAEAPWFIEAAQTKKSYASDPYHFKFLDSLLQTERNQTLTITSPIEGQSNELIGVLVRFIPLTYITRAFINDINKLIAEGVPFNDIALSDSTGQDLIVYEGESYIPLPTILTQNLKTQRYTVLEKSLGWNISISYVPTILQTFFTFPVHIILAIGFAITALILAFSYLVADLTLQLSMTKNSFLSLSTHLSKAGTINNDPIQYLHFITNYLDETVSRINYFGAQANILALDTTLRATNKNEAKKDFSNLIDEANGLADATKESASDLKEQIDNIKVALNSTIDKKNHI